MNPEINQEQLSTPEESNNTDSIQPQDGLDMTNDELAAAMGFMTTIGEKNMQQPEEGIEEAEQAPIEGKEQMAEDDGQEDPIAKMDSLKTEIMSELAELKESISALGEPKDEKSEINDLKKQIEEVLNQD